MSLLPSSLLDARCGRAFSTSTLLSYFNILSSPRRNSSPHGVTGTPPLALYPCVPAERRAPYPPSIRPRSGDQPSALALAAAPRAGGVAGKGRGLVYFPL
eukprot:scaffold216035_cov32-Tisochrysis_lutea.AAC.3